MPISLQAEADEIFEVETIFQIVWFLQLVDCFELLLIDWGVGGAGQIVLYKFRSAVSASYADFLSLFSSQLFNCALSSKSYNPMNYIATCRRSNCGPLTSAQLLEWFQLCRPRRWQSQMLLLYPKTALVCFTAVIGYVHHGAFFLALPPARLFQSQYFPREFVKCLYTTQKYDFTCDGTE